MLNGSGVGGGSAPGASGFFVVSLPLNCAGFVASVFGGAPGILSHRYASFGNPAPVAVIDMVAGILAPALGGVTVTFQSALPVDPANVSVRFLIVTSTSSTVVPVRFWKYTPWPNPSEPKFLALNIAPVNLLGS